KVPPRSIVNNLEFVEPPDVLKQLSIAEEILISPYRCRMHIIQLRSAMYKKMGIQQRKFKGNCVTFPQDLPGLVKKLPMSLSDLPSHLNVIIAGSHNPTKQQLARILSVSQEKIRAALSFLTTNGN